MDQNANHFPTVSCREGKYDNIKEFFDLVLIRAGGFKRRSFVILCNIVNQLTASSAKILIFFFRAFIACILNPIEKGNQILHREEEEAEGEAYDEAWAALALNLLNG